MSGRKEYKNNKKHCPKCGNWKYPCDFCSDVTSWDELNHTCKKCCNKQKKHYRGTWMGQYSYYMGNAKRRVLKFKLTKREFGAIVSQPCYYCGELQENFNGVDRVNSKKGYTIGNCVPCCSMCNRMKNIYSKEEFIMKCKAIVEKQEVMSY